MRRFTSSRATRSLYHVSQSKKGKGVRKSENLASHHRIELTAQSILLVSHLSPQTSIEEIALLKIFPIKRFLKFNLCHFHDGSARDIIRNHIWILDEVLPNEPVAKF